MPPSKGEGAGAPGRGRPSGAGAGSRGRRSGTGRRPAGRAHASDAASPQARQRPEGMLSGVARRAAASLLHWRRAAGGGSAVRAPARLRALAGQVVDDVAPQEPVGPEHRRADPRVLRGAAACQAGKHAGVAEHTASHTSRKPVNRQTEARGSLLQRTDDRPPGPAFMPLFSSSSVATAPPVYAPLLAPPSSGAAPRLTRQ